MTLTSVPPRVRVPVEHGMPLIRREQCACGVWIVAAYGATDQAISSAVALHQLNDRHRRWRRRQEAG